MIKTQSWILIEKRALNLYYFTNLCSKWLWEAAVRLSQITLHKFYDRGREVEFLGFCKHITIIQLVLYHKLRQVTYHLRGWSHLINKQRLCKFLNTNNKMKETEVQKSGCFFPFLEKKIF